MWLPLPSADTVKKFQALMKEGRNLELTNSEAQDYATRLLQIHYLLAYVGQKLPDHLEPHSPHQSSPPKKPCSPRSRRKSAV
jgi:hypothetical protein